MYSWEKSTREEKLKRNPRNPPHCPSVPSFSSSLLDEIYRSTDNGNEKFEELKFYRERIVKKQSNGGGGAKSKASNRIEDEEIAKSRTHCFTATRPKPKSEKLVKASYFEGNEFYLFDEFPRCGKIREDLKNEDGLMKTKLRALKNLQQFEENQRTDLSRWSAHKLYKLSLRQWKCEEDREELKLEVHACIIHLFIGFFVFQVVFEQKLDEFEGEIEQWHEEDSPVSSSERDRG
ncbi:hypothetical protein Acr_27g0000570 [Actinidia rufa]|uniref:Uncharacterized protein n=1 Tax=Actinidia rufa TaxID=165716 RepID=A0A7J0H5M7_9ERIC|nr:hypothetical protein Acr_27g0000570 [Actinidia rufa]